MNKISSAKKYPVRTSGMKKTAASKDSTSFNESVPVTDGSRFIPDEQGQAVPKKGVVVNENSDPYVATPMDSNGGQQQDTSAMQIPPQMAAAAHSFLGPEVMQAAMAGDTNAQDLIARTAAQMSSAFMNMSAGAQPQAAPAQGGQPGDDGYTEQAGIPAAPGAAPGAGTPTQGITSPEEDLANELAPDTTQMPIQQGAEQQAMQQEEQKEPAAE